jgi:hypothetical protein
MEAAQTLLHILQQGNPTPTEFGLYAGRQSRLKYKLHLKYFNGV